MPEDVSIEDVEDLYLESWRLGLKAVAIYRDNCKVGQPLSTQKKAGGRDVGAVEQVERIVETSSCRSRCGRSCRARAQRRRSRSGSPTATAT